MLFASWGSISVFHIKALWLIQMSEVTVNIIFPIITFCWFEVSFVLLGSSLSVHSIFPFANTESRKILLEKYVKSGL